MSRESASRPWESLENGLAFRNCDPKVSKPVIETTSRLTLRSGSCLRAGWISD